MSVVNTKGIVLNYENSLYKFQLSRVLASMLQKGDSVCSTSTTKSITLLNLQVEILELILNEPPLPSRLVLKVIIIIDLLTAGPY